MPIVRSHTTVNDRKTIENRTKRIRKNIKQIFWQKSIKCLNNIIIEGHLYTGVDKTIITPESYHPNWPIQESNAQYLGIEILSQVKQITRKVKCIGPQRKGAKLKPCEANIAMNLQECDLL